MCVCVCVCARARDPGPYGTQSHRARACKSARMCVSECKGEGQIGLALGLALGLVLGLGLGLLSIS